MLIITLALAATVLAAAPQPETALQEAEAAFDEADFDSALKTLDKMVAAGTDDPLLARAQLLRGRCFAAKGRFAEVDRAFALALESDPEARLDAASVGPQLVQRLEAVRARQVSQLSASADREGARVLLDGKELGAAPLKTSVPIGRHKVEIRTEDGRFVETKDIVFVPKRVHEVSLTLQDTGAPPEPATKVAEGTSTTQPSGAATSSKTLSTTKTPAPETGEDSGVTFVADVRGEGNPGKGLGFEVGVGVGGRHYAVTLHGVAGAYGGLTLRGALVFPELVAGLGAYGSLDVPLFFPQDVKDDKGNVLRQGGPLLGVGAAVGLRYDVLPWLAPFAEVGGRYYIVGPEATNFPDSPTQGSATVLIAAGLAFRVP